MSSDPGGKMSKNLAATIAIICGAIPIALAIYINSLEDTSDSSPTQPVATPSGPTCNVAWSNQTAEKARLKPPVRNMAMRRDGLHIVVSSAHWRALTLDERDRLVSAFDCAIAGPNYLRGVYVESTGGATLKTYSAIDLHDARRLQP